MADIRIKDLAVTAGSSASDDYLAVDGSTNGTRKLSAYSPTFGGNLTVSGTASSSSNTAFPGAFGANGQYRLYSNSVTGASLQGQGSTYDVYIMARDGSGAITVPTGTTNVGIGGNLTVSGTGTSTFGGTVLVGTAAAQGILASKNGSRFISLFSTSGGNGAILFDSTSALRFGTSTDETGSGFSELARLTAGGKLLLKSDGVDSTNGKIQLADHTTSAGGIGFGTGLSLFTSSTAGQLVLKDGSGTSPFLAFFDTSNNNRMAVGAIGTTSYVNSVAGPLQLWSSNTLALTFDGGQNATFAGQINGDSGFQFRGATGTYYELFRYVGGSNNPGLYVRATEATGTIRLEASGSSGQFPFEIASGGTLAATFNGANATFAGSIAIGNTVNTVSPTSPNRTITMVIGGTTYYIHAKTTND